VSVEVSGQGDAIDGVGLVLSRQEYVTWH